VTAASTAALEALLARDFAAERAVRLHGIRARLEGATRAVVFGAGALGTTVASRLATLGLPTVAYADNDPARRCSDVGGVPVMSPAAAIERAGDALWVIGVYTNAPLRRQCRDLGVRFVTHAELCWAHAQALLPFYAVDVPERVLMAAPAVLAAGALWADDESRREYLGQLSWRISLDYEALPPHRPPAELYFPDDLVSLSADEVFVDCGAFTGDTVEDFLRRSSSRFGRIVAIEPDPHNARLLRARLARLRRVHGRPMNARRTALGATRGRVAFDAAGTVASSAGTGLVDVRVAPLDDVLAGVAPTYIKIDVEGGERELLAGATRVFGSRPRPVAAVCLYHRPDDLWEIPLALHAMAPDHRLYLRRYSDECWESVCYAIPPERLAV